MYASPPQDPPVWVIDVSRNLRLEKNASFQNDFTLW